MDGEAGWWTTSGNIGLPPLARVMGVGSQQQQGKTFSKLSPLAIHKGVKGIAGGDVTIKRQFSSDSYTFLCKLQTCLKIIYKYT